MNALSDRRAEAHAPDDAALLAAFGARLRMLRMRRGMTQRALSERSGVSGRYVAQFEAGGGNVSILLLHRIAAALGVGAAALLADQDEPSADLAALHRMLARLDATRLEGARRALADWLGQPADPLRHGRIALIGLRGAGKSSLGRALAARRGVAFVELDGEVERLTGMELRDIFEMHGPTGFRQFERQALELLLAGCLTVWVRAAPEEHMQRVVRQGDRRPMRDNRRAMEDLRAILSSREALYGRADLQLDNRGRPLEASLEALIAQLATGGERAGGV
jgi:XRE family aerobic/anaerobic benzoate catabolism transcriptional regulator